jgi:hypothetical protein
MHRTDWLGFLLFRVLKMGSDSRFDTIRAHFFQFFGRFMHNFVRENFKLLLAVMCDRFLDWYVNSRNFSYNINAHRRVAAQILWVRTPLYL